MKFFSSYDPPPRKVHEKCPFEIPDYILDETTGELEPAGTIPFYKEIQSYADSCRLDYKLKKFAMGDTSILNGAAGIYGDFTDAPTDLRQILDSRKKLNKDFTELPEAVRALFGDSFDEFEKSVKDGTAERILGDYFRSEPSAAGSAAGAGAGGTASPRAAAEGSSNN